MAISKDEYSKMAKSASPNSPVLKNCIKAFFVGGTICAFAQILTELFSKTTMNSEEVKALVLFILIGITAMLTGIGVFDKIAKHGGAGTMVPITGFANSVVSPAMEHQREGWVLGLGANMLKVAGPVIVYGTAASVVYGVIYWIVQKI